MLPYRSTKMPEIVQLLIDTLVLTEGFLFVCFLFVFFFFFFETGFLCLALAVLERTLVALGV